MAIQALLAAPGINLERLAFALLLRFIAARLRRHQRPPSPSAAPRADQERNPAFQCLNRPWLLVLSIKRPR